MSIQPIDNKRTQGLQVRVFRDKKVYTRFLAYRKHGGKQATMMLARNVEQELEARCGPPTRARRNGCHASKPNRNNSSGIPGIRAYFLYSKDSAPSLQFSTFWTSLENGEKRAMRLQRSANSHGLLAALKQVLDAREQGSGVIMPTPRRAWNVIKHNLLL